MKKVITIILIMGFMGISWGADELTSSGQGVITELEPVGAPYTQSGEIQFRCVTTNLGPRNNIPPSTCTLTITYGNDLIKTITYSVPSLARGESYTYIWNTTNVDFPYDSFKTGGSYTIAAYWSYSGGYDSKSTEFQSIPTGWPATVSAAMILLLLVYIRNQKRNR